MKPLTKTDISTAIFAACMMVFLAVQLAQPRPGTPLSKDPPGDPDVLSMPCLLGAFEFRESSGRNMPPYTDCKREHLHTDNCRAFGYFSFHPARWAECGGKPERWGKATRVEQEAAMMNAIVRYAANCPSDTPADRLRWIANWHYVGHGTLRDTEYARAISTLYWNCWSGD